MDFKVAGLNPASFAETLDFQKSSAEVAPISLQDIRSLRYGFEREAETLRPVLGASEHQSMLIAMYEGTEQLLNRRVPAFAVHEYLEGLKGSAQELRNQGLANQEFRQQLFEQSRLSLHYVLNQG